MTLECRRLVPIILTADLQILLGEASASINWNYDAVLEKKLLKRFGNNMWCRSSQGSFEKGEDIASPRIAETYGKSNSGWQ